MSSRSIAVLMLATALCSGPAVAAGTPYHRAAEAFAAGQYEQALELLMIVYTNREHGPTAPASGGQAAVLHHNIGATYFRLGRYRAAANQFRRIAADPSLGPHALFGLGLAEARDGNVADAIGHLRAVADQPGAADLQVRAAAMLERGVAADHDEAPDWITLGTR